MDEPSKKLDLEFFPAQIIALNREVANHPALMKILSEQDNKDVYIRLCEIASYCNILLIGDYTHARILEVCEECTKVLYQKRTSIIIPYA